MKVGIAVTAAFIVGFILACFMDLPLQDSDDLAAPSPPTGGMTVTWDDVKGLHHIIFVNRDEVLHRDEPDEDGAQPLEHCSLPKEEPLYPDHPGDRDEFWIEKPPLFPRGHE